MLESDDIDDYRCSIAAANEAFRNEVKSRNVFRNAEEETVISLPPREPRKVSFKWNMKKED